MPRGKSDEEKVLDYFNDAPIGSAGTLFNVVKSIMKRRGGGDTAAKRSPKPAGERKSKSQPQGTPSVPAPSVNPAQMTIAGGE